MRLLLSSFSSLREELLHMSEDLQVRKHTEHTFILHCRQKSLQHQSDEMFGYSFVDTYTDA